MKQLILIMLLVVFVFGSHGLFSQEAEKVEEKAPEAKPVTTYDLTPKFLKDMSWEESLTAKEIQKSTYSERTKTYNLSGKAKIGQVNNNVPVEMKLTEFGGKIISERKYIEDGETSSDEDEIKKQEITFSIDKEYKLTFDVERINSRMEFLMYYPAGNLIEFEVPTKKIAVGETWISKNLYPVNFHLVPEELGEMEIKINKSEFKLEKVTNKNNSEIATIKWNGDCTIHELGGEEGINFSWSKTIQYDITSGRLLSSTGTLNAKIEDEGEAFSMTYTRTLKYGEKATEKVEPKVEPKDDDE